LCVCVLHEVFAFVMEVLPHERVHR
jgi:hypothetical protein